MIYQRLMQACGVLAALLLGSVVLLVSYDVIARNLGARSLPWIVEMTEYALPLATFLAAPWLMYRNQHIRLDLLGTILPAALLRRIDRLAALLSGLVSLIIAWYGLAALLDARAAGTLVIKSLVFPEWWLLLPLPLCFALLAIECLRRAMVQPAHEAPTVGGIEEARH